MDFSYAPASSSRSSLYCGSSAAAARKCSADSGQLRFFQQTVGEPRLRGGGLWVQFRRGRDRTARPAKSRPFRKAPGRTESWRAASCGFSATASFRDGQRFRRPLVPQQQCGQVHVRLIQARPEFECAAQFLNRLVVLFLQAQRESQIEVRGKVAWTPHVQPGEEAFPLRQADWHPALSGLQRGNPAAERTGK